MKIQKKIRNIEKFLQIVTVGEEYTLVVPEPETYRDALVELGFSWPLVEGEHILPANTKGIASRRNADGDAIVHRDQPMETAFRQMEWTRTEFRGKYDRELITEISDTSYKRYPRTHIPPFAVELQVRASNEGNLVIAAGPFRYSEVDIARATNTAQMLVEWFGGCDIYTARLTPLLPGRVRRLNWELLPRGQRPWQEALPALNTLISQAPRGNQPVIRARFETIGAHQPEFIAVGNGGFDGYVVFGFPARNLYVLESRETDNATYILGTDWERVSTMTKAEILAEDAYQHRLIHRRYWFQQLNNLLGCQPL